nr:hypothetical protein [Tanacetum cinerariifolium]
TNPPYELGWKDKPILDFEGNPTTATQQVQQLMLVRMLVRCGKRLRDGKPLESYYSMFYKLMNDLTRNQCKVTNHQVNVQFLLQLQPEWQRKREKAIVNSPQPIYDQEPSMVYDDDEDTSKDKEIDKLMALISLSFKKIYKPTNNNLRTSSNTSRANQDNSPQIHRNAGYEGQRSGTVAGARETVDAQNVSIESVDMNYDSQQLDQNDEDVDLAKE